MVSRKRNKGKARRAKAVEAEKEKDRIAKEAKAVEEEKENERIAKEAKDALERKIKDEETRLMPRKDRKPIANANKERKIQAADARHERDMQVLAVWHQREEAVAAFEHESSDDKRDDAKNLFGSGNDDRSSDEAKDTGAKLITLTTKRHGLFTLFSSYDSWNGLHRTKKCVTWVNEKSLCAHGLAPCSYVHSHPYGFASAFINEFNHVFGRPRNPHDHDVVAFAKTALDMVFNFTKENYSSVWSDPAKLDWTASFFLANGTQHLLDGNDSCARDCAFLSYAFEQHVAVTFDQSRLVINWPKVCELYIADRHTLVSFFHKRTDCSCLDKKYSEVKSIAKMGICYNLYCRHGRVVERNKTKSCSRCRVVNYCCRSCQKADWPMHKVTCGEVAELKAVFESKQKGGISDLRKFFDPQF